MRISAEEDPRFSGDGTDGHACRSILFFLSPSRPGDVENDRVKGGAEEARAGTRSRERERVLSAQGGRGLPLINKYSACRSTALGSPHPPPHIFPRLHASGRARFCFSAQNLCRTYRVFHLF